MNKNFVYIATSLDGKIADAEGGIAWLDAIQFPEGEDMGYQEFMKSVDALVMGRTTFETVLGFDQAWPYNKPVFVLSRSIQEIPASHKDKAFLVYGSLKDVLTEIRNKGYQNLYIDGGRTIQSFLKEDLIDEMIITVFPIVLGGGPSLFGDVSQPLNFELIASKSYFNHLVQNHFVRKRSK